jgi:hypothetical protein
MSYSNLPNGDIDPDSPGITSIFTKLRDNPEAGFYGLTGAPRVTPEAMGFYPLGHQSDETDGALTQADFPLAGGLYQCSSLNLASGTNTISDANGSEAHLIILCSGRVTVAAGATLHLDYKGANGGAAYTSTGTGNGRAGNPGCLGGGGGGGGGAQSAGTGGTGGDGAPRAFGGGGGAISTTGSAGTAIPALITDLFDKIGLFMGYGGSYYALTGGGGGGGGGDNSANSGYNGGAGGAGGGTIIIFCDELDLQGTISADGYPGSAGGGSYTIGGGGGGGGGLVLICARSVLNGTAAANLSASGGSGGAGGAGSSAAGGAGGDGHKIILEASS